MKRIYFAGSIRGGRDDAKLYSEIIKFIQTLKCEVLTEHVGLNNLQAIGETGKTNLQIYQRDMDWLAESDAVIAEVTNPSLGVGYEIAQAELMNKPILALHRPSPGNKLSAMIAGNPKIKVVEYQKPEDLDSKITRFITEL